MAACSGNWREEHAYGALLPCSADSLASKWSKTFSGDLLRLRIAQVFPLPTALGCRAVACAGPSIDGLALQEQRITVFFGNRGNRAGKGRFNPVTVTFFIGSTQNGIKTYSQPYAQKQTLFLRLDTRPSACGRVISRNPDLKTVMGAVRRPSMPYAEQAMAPGTLAFRRSHVAFMPGRTGQSPTRNSHRPGRAQLRHPVPLVKVSLSGMSA
jgi:hypothetical protein